MEPVIRQEIHFEGARAALIFDALVRPELHAQIIGAEVTGGTSVGDEFTAWDDYIRGRHLELAPGRRIVQAWRTTDFPDDAPDSRLEIDLYAAEGGTRLVMVHRGFPSEQGEDYAQGWMEHYWEPLRAWLAAQESLSTPPTAPAIAMGAHGLNGSAAIRAGAGLDDEEDELLGSDEEE